METPLKRKVLIVGGGVAGLSAALVLARAHYNVYIVDNGEQSNLASDEAHGVFTRDKTKPSDLYSIAKEQLLSYSNVSFNSDTVQTITKSGPFTATTALGQIITAGYIVLAQGVTYSRPDIDGLEAVWGTKVWHCPFCDGYEATDKKLLAIVDDEKQKHMEKLLPHWTTNIDFSKADQIQAIKNTSTGISVVFKNGSEQEYDQGLVQTTPTKRDDLADQLGCSWTESGHLVVNEMNKTTVDNVYCAGDQSNQMQQINLAVAAGHLAGMAIVSDL